MNRLKLFKEFIKYHEPKFNDTETGIFCCGLKCKNCKIQELCSSTNTNFSNPNLKYIKEKYPEYFI